MKRLVAVGVLLLFAFVSAARAENLSLPVNTCTETNCNARLFAGSILTFGTTQSPWVANFFADYDQCVRIEVISGASPANLEMVVVTPNSTVYRNDDKGFAPCPTCPLITFNEVPRSGWHTLRIGTTTGVGGPVSFTFLASRYNFGNPNCAAQTPPL